MYRPCKRFAAEKGQGRYNPSSRWLWFIRPVRDFEF